MVTVDVFEVDVDDDVVVETVEVVLVLDAVVVVAELVE